MKQWYNSIMSVEDELNNIFQDNTTDLSKIISEECLYECWECGGLHDRPSIGPCNWKIVEDYRKGLATKQDMEFKVILEEEFDGHPEDREGYDWEKQGR